ncbi:MAG: hypothetical protein HYS78_00655, partial [Parcubacteria group bacterium]|nr:hypothetical protein [Parcubacteria group bacterium]
MEVGGTASISGNITTLGTFVSTNAGSSSFSGGLAVTKGFSFSGEIRPDGLDCANGQILKKTGAEDWDCAADAAGGGVSSNSINFDEFQDTPILDASFAFGASASFNWDFNDVDLIADSRWVLDADGAFNGDGSITFGAGQDASIYFDGTDLVIFTDGAGASGIILDSEDDTLEFKGSGVLQATFDLDGLDLITGNTYQINNTDVLSGTTLGSGVTGSSLTSLGTISQLVFTNSSGSGNFELTGNTRLGINAGGATETSLEVGGTASISGATTLRGVTYTWPSADAAGVLNSNGSGTLSWAADDDVPEVGDFGNLVGGL